MESSSTSTCARGEENAARWVVPGALFVAELIAISLAIDLPTAGPAVRLAHGFRLVVPVVIGAAVGAWLIHRPVAQRPAGPALALPAWRPWPALGVQVALFAGVAAWGWRLLREGAPPPSAGALAAWLAALGAAGLAALAGAAPLGWYARLLLSRWRLPIVALALGLLAWRSAEAAEGLWGTLSTGTLYAVAAVVRVLAGEVTVDPAQKLIGLRGFDVLIAPVCSGADGLGLVLMFQATWLSVARARLRFPRALLLLPLGAAAALTANVVRLAVLVLLGASGHEALALGGFHSKLGWILFIAIALASVAAAERMEWLRRPTEARAPERAGVPETGAAFVAPLVATLAAAVVTGLASDGPFDAWYVVRILAALVALALVRGGLPRPAVSLSGTPILLGLAVGALWLLPAPEVDGGPLAAAVGALPAGARLAWIAARVAGSCLVIPLVEELAFRGFLLPWLSASAAVAGRRRFTWPAILVSSLAFGAVHQRWILGTAAGLVFAAAWARRGKLSDAVIAHAVANAAIALAVLWSGRWDLWS